MQGKLIIPFHFHLDLMCQPYAPNLTTNCFQHFTGESFEQKNTTSFSVTEMMGQEHEPLLTVNLNKKESVFSFSFHHFSVLFIGRPSAVPPFTTGNARWQSSLSISHSLWVHQTAKTNTLIIRTH